VGEGVHDAIALRDAVEAGADQRFGGQPSGGDGRQRVDGIELVRGPCLASCDR
jgi:hypothetical protein